MRAPLSVPEEAFEAAHALLAEVLWMRTSHDELLERIP
jgi:hypothetical protein